MVCLVWCWYGSRGYLLLRVVAGLPIACSDIEAKWLSTIRFVDASHVDVGRIVFDVVSCSWFPLCGLSMLLVVVLGRRRCVARTGQSVLLGCRLARLCGPSWMFFSLLLHIVSMVLEAKWLSTIRVGTRVVFVVSSPWVVDVARRGLGSSSLCSYGPKLWAVWHIVKCRGLPIACSDIEAKWLSTLRFVDASASTWVVLFSTRVCSWFPLRRSSSLCCTYGPKRIVGMQIGTSLWAVVDVPFLPLAHCARLLTIHYVLVCLFLFAMLIAHSRSFCLCWTTDLLC